MRDQNRILDSLFSILPSDKDKIELVIWYGNANGRDIDLFVVFGKELAGVFLGHHNYKSMDIGFIGKNHLPAMIQHLDPIFVEPILTGQAIFGDAEYYRKAIIGQPISRDIPAYLLHSAEEFYGWAVSLANEGLYREAILTLSFVQSYVSYAFCYWGGNSIVLFRDLLSKDNRLLIQRTRARFKKKGEISDADLYQSFAEARQSLTELRTIV